MKYLKVLTALSLALSLSACSNDPFKNDGACADPGKYKKIDGELAVCAGLEGKYKYYFEGTPFENMELLGRAEMSSLTFDSEVPLFNEAKARGLSDLIWQTNNDISNDAISRYANGDTRWDGLMEANSRRLSREAENKEALNYRFRMLNDWRAGKVSREVAFKAQQDQLEVAGRLEKAQAAFDEKLAVLRSEIKRQYGITDTVEVMLFLVVLQHPQTL
jgi:hypothetical protein